MIQSNPFSLINMKTIGIVAYTLVCHLEGAAEDAITDKRTTCPNSQ